MSDPNQLQAYWSEHVWAGFNKRIDGFRDINEVRKRKGEPPWSERGGQLNDATLGLCYDLAVLLANHSIDSGKRGDEAIRAFDEEKTRLTQGIESAWRDSQPRLDLASADETPPNFIKPFDRVREHLRLLLGKMPSAKVAPDPSVVREPIEDSTSEWEQICARFLRGAEEYPDVYAHWESKRELWTLWDNPTDDPVKLVDPQVEQLFKEITRDAVRVLGESTRDAPPWQVWLDLMRKGKRGFKRIWQMRYWRGGRDLEAFQESGVIPSDAIWTDNGQISHVFKESLEFCADLSLRLPASILVDKGPPASSSTDPQSESERSPQSTELMEGADRRELVDSFLKACNRASAIKIHKAHIWRFVGHKHARQFEYWQAGNDRIPGVPGGATSQDNVNFRRVLAMSPEAFVSEVAKTKRKPGN